MQFPKCSEAKESEGAAMMREAVEYGDVRFVLLWVSLGGLISLLGMAIWALMHWLSSREQLRPRRLPAKGAQYQPYGWGLVDAHEYEQMRSYASERWPVGVRH